MQSFEIPLFKWTMPANADLRLTQYLALVMSTDEADTAGAGVRIIGVQQNKPNIHQAVEIQSYGITKVMLGATVVAGADLAVDAAGKFITAAGAAAIVGQCLVGGDVDEVGCALLGASVAADPRNHFVGIQDKDVSSGTSFWVVAPVTGDIARVRSIVTTVLAGAGEPAALALELATVLVVGSEVVVAAEAAVGDTDDSGAITPHASTAVTAGDAIEITTDSTPTSGEVSIEIEIKPS
jgi:hypothetical protein